MATERDWRTEEDDPRLDDTLEGDEESPPSDDDETEDDGQTDSDEGEPETGDGVGTLLNAIASQEALKASKEADSAEFLAEMEKHLPGYQAPRTEPLSKYERAGAEVGKLDPQSPEFREMMQMLRTSTEETQRKAHAGSDGYDLDGDVLDVEAPFSPAELDSASFKLFTEAIVSGGASADPRKRPAGESLDSWSRKIDSALGRGRE